MIILNVSFGIFAFLPQGWLFICNLIGTLILYSYSFGVIKKRVAFNTVLDGLCLLMSHHRGEILL